MMQKLLTVAIPSYNMEAYLERCLESLIIDDPNIFNQLEVLVINDGSKDRTLEIAVKYQQLYPSVIRAIDKPNGNYGSCLNLAFQEAKALYFRTLDADDWFDTQAFRLFLQRLASLDDTPDLIITNYSEEYEGMSKPMFDCPLPNDQIFEYNRSFIDSAKLIYSIHTATYRTDIVRKIHLDERISYTDVEVNYLTLDYISTVQVFNDISLYKYFIGREGQSVSLNSYIKNVNHIYTVLNRFIEENKDKTLQDSFYAKQETTFALVRRYYQVCLLYVVGEADFQNFICIHRKFKSYMPSMYQAITQMTHAKVSYVKLWQKSPILFFPLWKKIATKLHLIH